MTTTTDTTGTVPTIEKLQQEEEEEQQQQQKINKYDNSSSNNQTNKRQHWSLCRADVFRYSSIQPMAMAEDGDAMLVLGKDARLPPAPLSGLSPYVRPASLPGAFLNRLNK